MSNQYKKAIIRNGEIVYGDNIEANRLQPNETAARENRQKMRNDHRKDLLQRNQVDYYKVYPEQAKNLSDETRRLLS